MGVMDTRVETARWKQGINNVYLVLGWSIFFLMLYAVFVMVAMGVGSPGYILSVAMRLIPSAAVYGLLVGGLGAIVIFGCYRHPATSGFSSNEVQNEIMPLQRGEVFTRGPKIRNGAWPETVIDARRKAREVGKSFEIGRG